MDGKNGASGLLMETHCEFDVKTVSSVMTRSGATSVVPPVLPAAKTLVRPWQEDVLPLPSLIQLPIEISPLLSRATLVVCPEASSVSLFHGSVRDGETEGLLSSAAGA